MKKTKIHNISSNQVEFLAMAEGISTPMTIASGCYHLVNKFEPTRATIILTKKRILEITEVDIEDENIETFKPSVEMMDIRVNDIKIPEHVPVQETHEAESKTIEMPEIEENVVQPKIISHIPKPIPEALAKMLEEQPKQNIQKPKGPTEDDLKREEEKLKQSEEKKTKQKEEKEEAKKKAAKQRERMEKVIKNLKEKNKQ